jgi:transposase-like protein
MKNSNINNIQTQELFAGIIEGKSPDIRQFLIDGMSDLLNRAFVAERSIYLSSNGNGNKANGYSLRNVNFGTSSIPMSVPRDRLGDFYPSMLPKYGRNIGESYADILEGIILNSKSFRSISETIFALGLPYSKEQVEMVLDELFDESKKYNSRQLVSDWAFVYVDAKVIDMVEEAGGIKKAMHFTVVGVNMKCKKELLLSIAFFGSESLEMWKKVITNLKNRGLCRVLMFITDDFSGLNKLLYHFPPQIDFLGEIFLRMKFKRKTACIRIYKRFFF